MRTPEELISQLADLLTRKGCLTDAAWRDALYAVPRHGFAPAVALCAGADNRFPIDRAARPDEWLNSVYAADAAIITQLDDGQTDVSTGSGDYTSALSAPDVVIDFLELLDVYDRDEVLDIGTGTGWTASLLAHRLGAGNVVSIEIDPVLARLAANNIRAAGFDPQLIVGDGEKGCVERAPYDRVHVTCGVDRLPYPWIEQTRPGGLIVFPWTPGFEGGHKTRLTVVGDGTAIGRFHGGAGYMMLRSQRLTLPRPAKDDSWRTSSTSLDPRRIVRSSTGADVAVAGMLPGVSCQTNDTVGDDGGTFDMWLWDGDSRAQATYSPGYEEAVVLQTGPRDLWGDLETAYTTWLRLGSPARERFGMTVSPDGQRIWIDTPDRHISIDGP